VLADVLEYTKELWHAFVSLVVKLKEVKLILIQNYPFIASLKKKISCSLRGY